MNADALIGITLGTCTLRRLIGRGGMGAVFLAQQSRPRRQVTIKILLPAAALTPDQLVAFLERFRRETDAAAALQHPNIMPVHEYGEQNGLAYVVMPYISGGTLRDELEQEGALAFPRTINYLEQLAAALDAAHGLGIVHRDVKPANILKTAEGRLLLTDFGLAKVLTEGQSPQVRLTGAGAPMGTPDFMAPEQVLGEQVDGRADLYSLGVILYQMVTGTVPFHGETPMQVAAQHLQTPPPPPRSLRPDLPVAAEQVMLRSLAKHAADRYACAQDLTAAFRVALTVSGVQLAGQLDGLPSPNEQATGKLFTRRGLFDPVWQAVPDPVPAALPPAPARNDHQESKNGQAINLPPRPAAKSSSSLAIGSRLGHKIGLLRASDAAEVALNPAPGNPVPNTPLPVSPAPPAGLLSSAPPANPDAPSPNPPAPAEPQPPAPLSAPGLFTPVHTPLPPEISKPDAPAAKNTPPPPDFLPAATGTQLAFPAPAFHPARRSSPAAGVTRALPTDSTGALPTGITRTLPDPTASALPGSTARSFSTGTTGAFPTSVTGALQATSPGNPVTLTNPVKVVQIPVAGQPGRYVTGLLPVLPPAQPASPATPAHVALKRARDFVGKRKKLALLATALLLVLVTSGVFLLVRARSPQSAQQITSTARVAATPDMNTLATAQAKATADADVILSDPLSQNIHNWAVSNSGSKLYFFEDGAYHIFDNDNNTGAPAIMPDVPSSILNGPLGYTLTMEEIKGDDSSINNQFGMIIRFNQHNKGNKIVTQFYSFEVVNTKNRNYQEYQFWKYDDSWGANVSPWTKIWHHSFGKEFHRGHGPGSVNTFKIYADGSHFTFFVNGQQVGTARENAFAGGGLGMLVNWKGTEVAFSNLLLTYY